MSPHTKSNAVGPGSSKSAGAGKTEVTWLGPPKPPTWNNPSSLLGKDRISVALSSRDEPLNLTRDSGGRFIAGKSGNPKGRPKKDTSLDSLAFHQVLRVLNKDRHVGGRRTSAIEIVTERLVAQAANGNTMAMKSLFKLQSDAKAEARALFSMQYKLLEEYEYKAVNYGDALPQKERELLAQLRKMVREIEGYDR